MKSHAVARMDHHVAETIHRNVLVFVAPKRVGVILICGTCAFQTRVGIRALIQDPSLRELLYSLDARLAFEARFRVLPPRDGSSWARVLDEKFL